MFVFTPRMRNSRSARSMRCSAMLKSWPDAVTFTKQRIVERRDDAPGVAHAAVEPDAETARGAIGENLAVIGREFVFRVFGRDAALDGVTLARNLVLRRQDRLPGRAASGPARPGFASARDRCR